MDVELKIWNGTGVDVGLDYDLWRRMRVMLLLSRSTTPPAEREVVPRKLLMMPAKVLRVIANLLGRRSSVAERAPAGIVHLRGSCDHATSRWLVST